LKKVTLNINFSSVKRSESFKKNPAIVTMGKAIFISYFLHTNASIFSPGAHF